MIGWHRLESWWVATLQPLNWNFSNLNFPFEPVIHLILFSLSSCLTLYLLWEVACRLLLFLFFLSFFCPPSKNQIRSLLLFPSCNNFRIFLLWSQQATCPSSVSCLNFFDTTPSPASGKNLQIGIRQGAERMLHVFVWGLVRHCFSTPEALKERFSLTFQPCIGLSDLVCALNLFHELISSRLKTWSTDGFSYSYTKTSKEEVHRKTRNNCWMICFCCIALGAKVIKT